MKITLLPYNPIYENIHSRLFHLINVRDKLKQELASGPEEKIRIDRSNSQTKYYICSDSTKPNGKYLSKKNEKQLRSLLQKKYNQKSIKYIDQEISVLNKLLSKAEECAACLKTLYSLFPEHSRQYIHPVDVTDEEYAAAWQAIPFVTKGVPDDLDYYTEKHEHVRSKSEINIANALFHAGIPYKYECPITLKGIGTIYPDFTVLDVRTRTVIYWEHRGRMGDPSYAEASVKRLKAFNANHIYLGTNLIITEETFTIPLGTHEINRIINHHFLHK